MADTIIQIADIIAEFGDYYQANGQNMNSIRRDIYYGFDSASAFTLMPTDDTVIRLSEADVEEVLQPYQDDFTPKGSVEFKPFQMMLEQIKVDQRFNPNKLVKSWLGFLTTTNNDRSTWPFVRWFIEMYLVPIIQQDMEMKVAYKGVKNAPTTGVAGAAIDSCNGVKKVINTMIAANEITPISIGAWPTAPEDFVTCIEEQFVRDGMEEKYWNLGLELNMSAKLAQRFREGMRKKYNMHYAQTAELNKLIDYNITVAPRNSMQGSEKVWATPKTNAIMGIRGASNLSTFDIEKCDRNVKIYTDFFLGFGFVMGKHVFTNDLELS